MADLHGLVGIFSMTISVKGDVVTMESELEGKKDVYIKRKLDSTLEPSDW